MARLGTLRYKLVSPELPGRAVELLKIPAPEAPQLTTGSPRWSGTSSCRSRWPGLRCCCIPSISRRGLAESWATLEIAVETTQYFFWIYIGLNIVVAACLLAMRRLPLPLVQWVVFAMSLVDGIFLSALAVVTGGYDSMLYWLFLG